MSGDGWLSDEDVYPEQPQVEVVQERTFTNQKWRERHSNNASNSYKVNGDTIEVASHLVGKIIGRGGSKIKELESDSQARIKIINGQGSDMATLNISGSREAKEKARGLIEKLLDDRPQRNYRDNQDRRPQRGFNNRENNSYSQNNRENNSYSHNSRDNNSYSQNRDNNSYSQNRDNNSYSQNRENNSYSHNRDNNSYSNRENNSYSHNSRDNNSYSRGSSGGNYSHSNNDNWRNNSYRQEEQSYGGSGVVEPQVTSTSHETPQDDQEDTSYDWVANLERCKKLKEAHWATLPTIYKNFYIEDKAIAAMSPMEVTQWRMDNNNITVERVQHDGTETLPPIPNPVHTFEQAFAPHPDVLREIYKQGFEKPSPIQSQAWPVLLSGDDLIGIAQTGTGKTLAFLLPALIHTERQPTPIHERNGPNVLILAPTRELAIQIDKEVKKYEYKGYKSVCIYGGASRSDQIDAINNGVQIVIATPGRLNDLVMSKHINVESVTYLVLDEADRMLDMGFGPQIRVSLLEIRPTRQTVMTSATWPSGVQRLAELYMKNPIRVIVGSLDLAAVHSVEQSLIFVDDDIQEKFQMLLDFFDTLDPTDKVIVFCSKKTTTISIASDLALKGIRFTSIYGGLEQSDREQALEDMRNGDASILVATDVASRGIDISDITHIVNFDFPTSLEEFVHRVGRTGRAGKTGKAITYMTRRDWDKAEGLIDILEEAGQVVPQELVNMAQRFARKKAETPARGRGRGRGGYNRYDY